MAKLGRLGTTGPLERLGCGRNPFQQVEFDLIPWPKAFDHGSNPRLKFHGVFTRQHRDPGGKPVLEAVKS
jgi:hypothetical protein